MRKIFMLAAANIRKAKSQTVSFLLIIVISSLLLNLGLVTMLNYSNNFDKKYTELNSAHIWQVMNNSIYKDEYYNYVKNLKGVTETEKRDVLYFKGSFTFGKSDIEQNIVLFDADNKNKISKVSYIDKLDKLPADAIFLPYIMKAGGKLKLGEHFTIERGKTKHVFTVAGFYEEMNTGTINTQLIGFILPHNEWMELKETTGDKLDGTMLLSRVNDKEQGKRISSEIYNHIIANLDVQQTATIQELDYETLKLARTTTANMGTSVIILFSLVITLVSLIVIRFRIRNSIETDINNIGALKAVGYTSKQLIKSFLVQFSGTALLASLFGGILSLFALPVLKEGYSAQTGIIWNQGFDAKSFIISIAFIVLITVLVSFQSARKIKKLEPITALRNGITTHSFKRNYLPLDKSKGSVNYLLSMKTMLHNTRQNIMIVVIIAAICFISVFALVIYYNMVVNDKAFVDVIAGEYSNASLMLDNDNYNSHLIEQIGENSQVRKVIYYDSVSALYNNNETFNIYVTKDFSVTENKKCYDGRDPIHDNEIALNGYLAGNLKKKIGDTITVRLGKKSSEYLITGLMQTANGSAYDSELTAAGFKRICSSYKPMNIFVYLKKGTNTKLFLKDIQNEYGNYIKSIQNSDEMKESMLNVFVQIITLTAYVIILITAAIIALILFLVIKTLVIRNRQEFGIKKAIGFTTRQLVFQLSLSFLPIAALGSVIGGVIGYLGINPLLTIMMRSMGIMKMNFIIQPVTLIILCLAICIFTYIVASLVSLRIRKISAVSLISE
ncbi:MAG: ABC transporter permease [Bacillota bacterium]|nr:ABC transporter permease [Bacillota bacterium]